MPQKRIPLFDTTEDQTLRIQTALACKIGFNEAVILMQLEYLISIANHQREGKVWTWQSLTDLKENHFPWWSIATISRGLKSLEEQGLIYIDSFNKRAGDKTQWFALNFEAIEKLDCVKLNDNHPIFQNEKWVEDGMPGEPEETEKGAEINGIGLPHFSNCNTIFQFETPIFQFETTLPETPTEISNTEELPKGNGATPHQPLVENFEEPIPEPEEVAPEEPITPQETLLPDSPEALFLFEKINHNRKLRSWGPVKNFKSLEQKQKCQGAASRLGNKRFKAGITKGLEKGLTDLASLVNWIALWETKNKKGSRQNGQKPIREGEPGIIAAAQRASGDKAEYPASPGSSPDSGAEPAGVHRGGGLLAGY